MSSMKSAPELSTRGVSDLRTGKIRLNRLAKMLYLYRDRVVYIRQRVLESVSHSSAVECNIVRIGRESHRSNKVSS
jgi:hypothetical protein